MHGPGMQTGFYELEMWPIVERFYNYHVADVKTLIKHNIQGFPDAAYHADSYEKTYMKNHPI